MLRLRLSYERFNGAQGPVLHMFSTIANFGNSETTVEQLLKKLDRIFNAQDRAPIQENVVERQQLSSEFELLGSHEISPEQTASELRIALISTNFQPNSITVLIGSEYPESSGNGFPNPVLKDGKVSDLLMEPIAETQILFEICR